MLRTAHVGVGLRSALPPGSMGMQVQGPTVMGDDEQRDPALSPVDGPVTSTGRVASWAVRWLGASWGWSTRAGRFIGVYGTTAG